MNSRSMVLVSVFSLGLVVNITAQTDGNSKGNGIDPAKQKQLLRQPNGLKKMAEIAGGHLALADTREPGYVEYDLVSAQRDASLILSAYINDLAAKLSEMGSSIDTEYKASPVEVFKGSIHSPEITIKIRGGRVEFPDGESAEIKSIASTHVERGREYIFFLRKDNDGSYWPVGGFQAILDVTRADNVVPLAKYSKNREFRMTSQLREAQLNSLDKVSAAIRRGLTK